MQSADTITFHCPSCGVKLSVPSQMAGVVGPCPKCGDEIKAPEKGSEVIISEPEQVTEEPDLDPVPRIAKKSVDKELQLDLLGMELEVEPEPQSLPELEIEPISKPESPLLHESPPEPLPDLIVVEPISSGSVQEPLGEEEAEFEPEPSRPRRMGVLFPMGFLVAAGAIVFVLMEAGSLTDIWGEKSTQPMPPDLISDEVVATQIPPEKVESPPKVEPEEKPPTPVLVKPAIERPAVVAEIPEVEDEEPTLPEPIPEPVLVKPKKPAPEPPAGEFPDLLPPSVIDLKVDTANQSAPKPNPEESPAER